MVQYFVDADFLEIYDGLEYVSWQGYQIDITGFVSYPDLNISQIFDPPIYGYIVKITQILTRPSPQPLKKEIRFPSSDLGVSK